MKVKQLIESLQVIENKELEVVCAGDNEDWGHISEASIITNQEDFPYQKGDAPDEDEFPLVLI
ncbi:MAG: hypothetical protein Q7R56_01780 [Nanoarchaeota archaeon]|nr:hypothetical protein [Nanoarchaeota archaeon]